MIERAAISSTEQNEELILINDSKRESVVPLSNSVGKAKEAGALKEHSEYDMQLQRRYFAIAEPLWHIGSPRHWQRNQEHTSAMVAGVASHQSQISGLMRCLTCGRAEHPEVICPEQQVCFRSSKASVLASFGNAMSCVKDYQPLNPLSSCTLTVPY